MKPGLPNDKDNRQNRDAIRRQPAAVERIIGRQFEPDQIDAPTIDPTLRPRYRP